MLNGAAVILWRCVRGGRILENQQAARGSLARRTF